MAVQDVLIGPGRLFVAPLGEANPDETTVAYGASWGGNWTDFGDFPEGSPVTLSINETTVKVYGEQSTGVKKQVRTRREVVISGALLEHTIANWAYLLDATADAAVSAGASQKAYQELPFGVQTDISEYKFGIEALRKDTSDGNQPIRWFLHRGSIMLGADVAYAKQNPTSMGFEITILEDDTQSANEELGILQIVTAPASS